MVFYLYYIIFLLLDLNQLFAVTKAVEVEKNRADPKPLSWHAMGSMGLLSTFHLLLFDWGDLSLSVMELSPCRLCFPSY